jgi:hypothetical protein
MHQSLTSSKHFSGSISNSMKLSSDLLRLSNNGTMKTLNLEFTTNYSRVDCPDNQEQRSIVEIWISFMQKRKVSYLNSEYGAFPFAIFSLFF